MSLVTIILALIIERTRHYRSRWWWQEGCFFWFNWLPGRSNLSYLAFGVVLPTLAVALLQWWLPGKLWGVGSFLLWLLIPLFTLGCPGLQAMFRDYLKASAHDREAACVLFNQQLDRLFPGVAAMPLNSQEQVSRFLCWLNFRYYFSVIFWFSLGGPVLALCYGLLRSLQSWAIDHPERGCSGHVVAAVLQVIDWIPTRLASLSYICCRGSMAALRVWLHSFVELRRANAESLGQIAQLCRGIDADEQSYNAMIINTVELLKGALLFSLVVIALLTLYGWLI